jgi:hypothetical protein
MHSTSASVRLPLDFIGWGKHWLDLGPHTYR